MRLKEELIQLSGRQIAVSGQERKDYPSNFDQIAAITLHDTTYHCNRCGSICNSFLPGKIAYCRECIGLGRVSSADFLMRIKRENILPKKEHVLAWKGTLTPAQATVSQELIASYSMRSNHLVHAVTGAGKTEMLFAVVAKALESGGRVALATPRIDVVNELAPRFAAAFCQIQLGKYHGKDYQEPADDDLVICTTHQLLKFYQAFDLVIIDEVDAFPYRDSDLLAFGAKNAQKNGGCTFYLTATPSKAQLLEVKQQKINYSLLRRRFHGFDLPVPQAKLLLLPSINKHGKINKKVLLQIRKLVSLNKPLMIFVPKIRQLENYLSQLEYNFANKQVASVHAADADRLAKIEAFRNGQLDILLTTTILERGVTIKEAQVIVLDADDRIYNTASLVQIAGRVGRSANDPSGNVLFFYHEFRATISDAIKQIKGMNRL